MGLTAPLIQARRTADMDLSMQAGTPATTQTATTDAAAKDTRKGESTLPSDVLDLLAAIRDAVEVPLPSNEPADERAWHQLMYRRLTDLRVSLSVALDAKWVCRWPAPCAPTYSTAWTPPTRLTTFTPVPLPQNVGERP